MSACSCPHGNMTSQWKKKETGDFTRKFSRNSSWVQLWKKCGVNNPRVMNFKSQRLLTRSFWNVRRKNGKLFYINFFFRNFRQLRLLMAVYEQVYVVICCRIVGRIHYSRNCNKKPFRSVASLLNWKMYSWFWGGVQISHGNFSARMPHGSSLFSNIFWYFTKCVMKKITEGAQFFKVNKFLLPLSSE